MEKKPFVTKEQLDEITAKFPTPYHLYDEKGIREDVDGEPEHAEHALQDKAQVGSQHSLCSFPCGL